MKLNRFIFGFIFLFTISFWQISFAGNENLHDPNGQLRYYHDTLRSFTKTWERELGIDIHIVVIHKTVADIVTKAQEIFQQRNIGKSAKTGGVLILINSKTSEARITVSHNLEAVFTDAVTGAIAKSQLAPYASYNMAGMAVMDTVHLLKNHLLIKVASGAFVLDQYYREQKGNQTILGYFSGGGGGNTKIPEIDFNQSFKKKPKEKDYFKYAPGTDPLQSIEAYINTRRDMVGYPLLPLLTESSQILLEYYPFAPYESFVRSIRIEQSKPLTIKIQGDYAVAVSNNPALGYHPILLKREDGLWLIDLSSMFKNIFFSDDGATYQVNGNHPYAFGLTVTSRTKDEDIRAIALPASQSLRQVINNLKENSGDSMSYYMIAELLFRNCWAAHESFEYYNKAINLSPNNKHFRQTLIDRYLYMGMYTMAVPHAQAITDDPLQLVKIATYAEKYNIARRALKEYGNKNPTKIPVVQKWYDRIDRREKANQ